MKNHLLVVLMLVIDLIVDLKFVYHYILLVRFVLYFLELAERRRDGVGIARVYSGYCLGQFWTPADRRWCCSVRIVGCEKLLEIFIAAGVLVSDNPGFIDQQRDGNSGDLKEIQGIDKHRPVHLLPLHEQPGAVTMLLLRDSDHAQIA